MRNPDRIQPFCDRLAEIWRTNCPDWRFGQFVSNITAYIGDPFYFEEDEMIKKIEQYFIPKTKE